METRALALEAQGARLDAVVNGRDPGLSWIFEDAVPVAVVRVEVTAPLSGPLQLFWATPRCPVYSEACSATLALTPGRNVVSFLLDPAAPLRSLRLDLPEGEGNAWSFDLVEVRKDAAAHSAWAAGAKDVVVVDARGLHLEASLANPRLTVATPGLEAERVTAFELVLLAGAGEAPRLYWEGPCGPAFSEACSVVLARADAGALTHRAVLKGFPRWTGRISALRLDPGPDAGSYLIEQMALVHDPAD